MEALKSFEAQGGLRPSFEIPLGKMKLDDSLALSDEVFRVVSGHDIYNCGDKTQQSEKRPSFIEACKEAEEIRHR